MTRTTQSQIELIQQNHFAGTTLRNATPARLYQDAISFDGGVVTDSGSIATSSGTSTGRCPRDKRIVDTETVHEDVWWGSVNIPIGTDSFARLRARAIDFLNESPRLYVVDGFAGWDQTNRIKVRVVCSRPYHALFMHNMLIRPSQEELAEFGQPDYVIFNAGQQTADTGIEGVTSTNSVSINFDNGEMVILGTEYAGEMKKGVFTIMNYLMPKKGVLSMHCSANESLDGQVTLFFGLSGTGKTTLSADPRRRLIGDDEHCWNESGIFNIEGGCYAKCIQLSAEKEPQIYRAIRFGSILENTVQDPRSHVVDYDDASLTQNTRCSYPIDFIDNAKIPCVGSHPKHIILLTCDAFGVLPPVSRLTPAQAMYHFISGYTAKVAGTEVGVTEPEATFSACFGAAFLVWHPTRYAELLAEKIKQYDAQAWLVNTGWTGGSYGEGSRINLQHTRAIIDAIHNGGLESVETVVDPVFRLAVPIECPNVPSEILQPKLTWSDQDSFQASALLLAKKLTENFSAFRDVASAEICAAGPAC